MSENKETIQVRNKRGDGETLTVIFKRRSGDELKALAVAKELARRGNRTRYLVALFAAVYDVWAKTGRFPEHAELTSVIHNLGGVNAPFPEAPDVPMSKYHSG